jgi:hypothetical protein
VRDESSAQEHYVLRRGIDDAENAAHALAVGATLAPPDENGASDRAWYGPGGTRRRTRMCTVVR